MDTFLNGLPIHDPTSPVDVLVEAHVWRKIGEKHMSEPFEPWDDWMGQNLVSAFRAIWPLGCREESHRATVRDVSNHVRRDALASLQAPLLISYTYQQKGSPDASSTTVRLGKPEPTKRLVLPNGGLAELRRRTDGGWSMRTCYFDRVSGRGVPLWQRYRKLVAKLRTRYIRVPGPLGLEIADPHLKDDCIEWGIEFVSRYNWGLEASTPPDPWNYLPPPWPQAPALPTIPPTGLLRPLTPGGGSP